MFEWEVCSGVGWKEEEVAGRRVQECKWMSTKPANKNLSYFLVWNPQASAPITSGTHTDGGAVIR